MEEDINNEKVDKVKGFVNKTMEKKSNKPQSTPVVNKASKFSK
jgi:hypothetical protein